MIALDEGESVPVAVDTFSGLCFMGGPMSVNDPLPWIEPVGQLIRLAVERDIPVIGHCLGGQLISKALGGSVIRNTVKEIGWSEAKAEPSDIATHWLGRFASANGTVFHWHGETFSIPAGATRLLSTTHCANQMFVLGPHLAMQCHVEMTPEMITSWSAHWADETTGLAKQPSIQTPEQMIGEAASRVAAMRKLSDQLYAVWITGLAR